MFKYKTKTKTMNKEQVLRLIKEYQDYSKTNDYPKGEDEINQEELEIHEEVATALREELEKNPQFFIELDNSDIIKHIKNKHQEIQNKKQE